MRNHAEANLAALIESTDDLIWSVDLDYRLLAFNSAIKQQINSSLQLGCTWKKPSHQRGRYFCLLYMSVFCEKAPSGSSTP